jgi:hypothetical protein
MNSQLYHRTWNFPEDMRNHMKICFAKVKGADQNTEGYNRNVRLQNTQQLSYPELKRIKNFFDNFQGRNVDAPFILNGENKMKDFVNTCLSTSRQVVQGSEKIRRTTGMDNEYIQTPTADINLNIANTTPKKTNIQQYDLKVMENLKRINEIFSKI